MAIKTFTDLTTLPASDINTYLANSGLVYVGEFTASGSSRALVCDNIFTSSFDNYRLHVELNSNSNTNGCFYQYIDSGGSTVATGYFQSAYGQDYAGGGTGFIGTLNSNVLQSLGYLPNNTAGPQSLVCSMDIFGPNTTTVATAVLGQHAGISSGAYFHGGQFMGNLGTKNAMRGIRIDNGSGTNLIGKVFVYGYRKA